MLFSHKVLCRNHLLHCSNESFWLWPEKPEHLLHVSTLLLTSNGVATSCTTNNKCADREHHSDPAISPRLLHTKIF